MRHLYFVFPKDGRTLTRLTVAVVMRSCYLGLKVLIDVYQGYSKVQGGPKTGLFLNVSNTMLKITSKFSDNVRFCMHFISNSQLALLSYTFQLRQHSACPSCALITVVSILTVGLSLHLLCPDLSDLSSLRERTSDNKRIGSSNDTTSVAKHPTLKNQLN